MSKRNVETVRRFNAVWDADLLRAVEVWTMRDGRIAGFRVYLSRDEALRWIEAGVTEGGEP